MSKNAVRAAAALVGVTTLLALGILTSCRQPGPGRTSAGPATASSPSDAAPVRSNPDVVSASGPTVATPISSTQIAGSLELSPVPALQGGTVRIVGRGFAPGELVLVQATSGSSGPPDVDLAEVQADRQGTLRLTGQRLPRQLTSGAHAIAAVGEASGTRDQSTLYVRATSTWVNLSKAEVSPWEKLAFVAGGFAPNERVVVTLEPRKNGSDDKATPSPTPAGSVNSGATSGPRPTVGATPGARPAASPTPNGPVVLAVLPTDRVGNTVWSEVATTHAPRGSYSLVLTGGKSKLQVRRDVTLDPYRPIVELSPWYGLPGTTVQLNIKGLAPGESVHIFVGYNAREAGRGVADQYGNLWAGGPVRVPYDAGTGSLAFTILGDESHAPTTVQYKVGQAKPWLELTNWWGPPGAPESFTGGGWDGLEDVTVHLDDAWGPVVATAKADDYGWLHGSSVAYIPTEATRDVVFVAVGQQSHTSCKATFKLVFPYGIKPSP